MNTFGERYTKPGPGSVSRLWSHDFEIVLDVCASFTEDRITNAKKIINLFQIIAHKNIFRQVESVQNTKYPYLLFFMKKSEKVLDK